MMIIITEKYPNNRREYIAESTRADPTFYSSKYAPILLSTRMAGQRQVHSDRA